MDDTIIRNLKEFLSHHETKRDLTKFLATKLLDHSLSPQNKLKKFLVSYETVTRGNFKVPDKLCTYDHEEADSLIILHASTVPMGSQCYVQSPDTDIFLLLTSYSGKIPRQTFFNTGKGNRIRNISISDVCEALSPKYRNALIGYHSLTGTDTTGKIACVTKDSSFNCFLNATEYMIEGLSQLGDSETISEDMYGRLTAFLCKLYKTKFTQIEKARWYHFCLGSEGEKLPPTKGNQSFHFTDRN